MSDLFTSQMKDVPDLLSVVSEVKKRPLFSAEQTSSSLVMSVQVKRKRVSEINGDVVSEILARLPVKSLFRFKSVCKDWREFISSQYFCGVRSSNNICGLLLRKSYVHDERLDFIPFKPGQSAPFERIDFVTCDKGRLDVIQHCNGLLLLCRGYCHYYVFNPSTRQHAEIAWNGGPPYEVYLAFDPRISPHYKLLYITSRDDDDDYGLNVYSSETGLTRKLDHQCRTSLLLISVGIFWNGCIHWKDHLGDDGIFYFSFSDECFRDLPFPPVTQGAVTGSSRRIHYFGESNDHLHLILTDINFSPQFDVYELERDHSGWLVRFRVDLGPVLTSFGCYDDSGFGIISMVENDDEKPFLVLSLPGKAVRFCPSDGSFSKMCDFSPRIRNYGLSTELPLYHCYDTVHLVESLHPV